MTRFGFRSFLAAMLLFAAGSHNAAAAATDRGEALKWVGSWASPPSNEIATMPISEPPPFVDQTIRTVATLSAGGEQIRLRLSNELGVAPLRIGAVTIGRWRNGAVVRGSFVPVPFHGNRALLLPGGAAANSDPLEFATQRNEQVVVSIHVIGPALKLTGHLLGLDQSWSISGDKTTAEQLPAALPFVSRLILTRLDVAAHTDRAETIVALGDSITDGYQSSFAGAKRWPDFLARALLPKGDCLTGVVNQGISSNQVLASGDGISAVGRLHRDVFDVPNARTLIVLEGINDLGMPPLTGQPPASAPDLMAAFQRIADEAHARGMKIVVATIMPYAGAGTPYFTPEGETSRQEVNSWIRTSQSFDKVVDLDRALADPRSKDRLAPEYDSGDGLHPSDKGYEAIARAVQMQLGEGICR